MTLFPITNLEISLKNTKLLCIVQEGNCFGSFGSEVVSSLIKNNFNVNEHFLLNK